MTRRDFYVLLAIVVVVFGTGAIFAWVSLVGVVQQTASVDGTPVGYPVHWQMNFQLPASPVQEDLYWLHNLLFVVNIAITGLVFVLMFYIVWRFRESRNPVPQRTTHSTVLEVVWTIVPVIVLVGIAVPSFQALWRSSILPETELTVKVTGRQWFWEYEYPDSGVQITSLMAQREDLPAERRHLFLLAVDKPLVLPVGTVIRLQITSGDVMHAWPVPSLGVRRDAIPGRINEAWTRIDREGVYFGQCSELCGVNHAYMPIEVRAVSPEAFRAFIAERRQTQGSEG